MPIHNELLFKNTPKLLVGNVQIIACAGSGKTEFVSERIAYQIYTGIAKPSEIVALTFNDAAAKELKFRVRDKIKDLLGKQPDIGDMYIGTIHAFAFKILQDFVPQYRGYDMLNENSRKAFAASLKWENDINLWGLYNALKEKGYQLPFNKDNNAKLHESWTLNAFLADVDFYREESISEDAISASVFKPSLASYLEKLDERRFLDFSGILRLAVDHLKADPYIVEQIQKQCKFFTVDEYQDVNPIQEQLIRLVSGQSNVCVVGDDDQSIYQWRGADVDNIINFPTNYPNVTTYKLETNRRSHGNIIACAAEFISGNAKRLYKNIQANEAKSQLGDLYKIGFDTQSEEVQWVTNKVNALYGTEYVDKGIQRKLRYSDMAFLFRRRIDAHEYKKALEESGINVVYSGMGGLMDSELISSIIKTIKYIGESVNDDDSEPNESLNDIYDELYTTFKVKIVEFKAVVTELIVWCKEQKRLSLQAFYYKLLSGLGLGDIAFHDKAADEVILYNLGRFSQTISDFESSRTFLSKNDIVRFVDYIQTFVSNSYDEGSTDANAGLIDAVNIMTLHGTKGLGFPVVFMPCLKGRTTNNHDRVTFLDTTKINFARYDGSEEDERRLYYVAITRAKKYLFITTHQTKIGNRNRTAFHPFFNEISSDYFLITDVPDPTKRVSCDIEKHDSDTLFPTNYSELSYYLSCSYDYRMRFIYGFNPELVQALGYGKQVHNLINLMHRNYERTRNIPGEVEIIELVDKHFYLRYAAVKQREVLKKSCIGSLTNYVKLWRNDFSLALKTEQNFEMDFDNKALINGSIDMLQRVPEVDDVLEIIDFKTGKQQSQFEEKYAHQVVLYTIAAREALLKNVSKAYLHYLDAKDAKRVEVLITEEKINETRSKLKNAVNGITNNKFPRNPEMGLCRNCDWNTICPKNS